MSFAVAVVNPLVEPVPPEWDRFVAEVGSQPLWESLLLRGLAWYSTNPPVMAIVSDARSGRTAALVHGYHRGLAPTPHTFVAPRRRRRVGVVECHVPPGRVMSGHLFHPDLDHADRVAALVAVERAVCRRFPGCVGVVYRQVSDEETAVFRRRRGVVLPALSEAVVENRWDDVDGWLASRPRRQRKSLLWLRRTVQGDPTVTAAIESRVSAREFGPLVHHVRMRHQPRRSIVSPIPALFFDTVSRLGCARYFTYRDPDGALLAGSLLIDDGTTLRCLAWGNRPAAEGGRRNLYFDHYLRQVTYLIEHRRERMVMGKGMYDLKERFGADQVPRYLAAVWR